MRSRTGTSAINRRKYTSKATKKTTSSTTKKPVTKITKTTTQTTTQPTQQPTQQPTKRPTPQQTIIPATQQATQRIVPGSTSVSAAGIVVAAPGAADRQSGGRPVSTNLGGGEIKVDDEGRMDLSEIENMNPLVAGARGVVVPTEQIVGIAKDIAYGVASEDQKTVESGLDLIINPMIKPFMDPKLRDEGVIQSEWYWPEELKADWGVLPPFMQKGGEGKPPETRSFVDGMSGVFGNVGAIVQSPVAHQIASDEGAVSLERFTRSPSTAAYYIGSGLGEIPYFIIGAGQVKAVGTIAAKATAGVVRGGLKGTTGAKVIAVAYKIERATDKLQSISNKANAGKYLTNPNSLKVITKPEVLKSVDLLKKGYAKNTAVQQEGIARNKKLIDDPSVDEMNKIQFKFENEKSLKNIQSNNKNLGEINRKFGTARINELDNMKTDGIDGNLTKAKALDIDAFNVEVQMDLLPKMKKFKDGYLAHATDVARGTKTEKIAQLIEGSPNDFSRRLDLFFNKPGKTMGDSDIPNKDLWNIQRTRMDRRVAAGEYAGVMGKIKFNKDLYGGTIKSSLGVNRAQGKLNAYTEVISRNFPTLRVISRKQFITIDKNLTDERTKLIDYNKNIEKEKIKGTELKEDRKAIIEDNKNRINVIDETLNDNKKTRLQMIAHTASRSRKDKDGNIKDHTTETTEYVYYYDALQKVYPQLAEKLIPKKILFGAQPSVNIEKRHGIMMGTIGDALEGTKETIGGKTFWFTEMGRKEAAATYGEKYLSKKPNWTKKIGLRKVGRYKTWVPKKVEPKEKIMHWYEATDVPLPSSGKGKSGVRPVVFLNKETNLTDLYVLKKQLHLREYTGDKSVTNVFGKDKIVLEYDDIQQVDIEKIQPQIKTDPKTTSRTFGKTVIHYGFENKGSSMPEINGIELHRILKNRATFENRPDMAREFVDIETHIIDKKIKDAHQLYATKKREIKNKTSYHSQFGRERAYEALEKESLAKIKKLKIKRTKKIEERDANQEKLREINIRTQAYSTANPRGTVTSATWEKVLQHDKFLENKYMTDQIIDKTTGKRYFISGEKWYEVTDESFDPSMVTLFKDVKHQRSERRFIAGSKYKDEKTGIEKDNFYDEDLLATDSTMGLGKMQYSKWQTDPKIPMEGILPKKGEAFVDGGYIDNLSAKGHLKKLYKEKGSEMYEARTALDDLDADTSRNKIFLNNDIEKNRQKIMGQLEKEKISSEEAKRKLDILDKKEKQNLKGMLKPLSTEDQAIFESGSVLGKSITKSKAKVEAVDQSSPNLILTTDFKQPFIAKKSAKQLVEQNVAITLGKGIIKNTQGLSNARSRLNKLLKGDRFIRVSKQSFTPDTFHSKNSGLMYGDSMVEGKSIIVSGADDPWSRMIMSTQADEILQDGTVLNVIPQGQIVGGVKQVPVYDATTVAHLIDESISNKFEKHAGKGLQSNKGTNYEQVMEIAERQQNVPAFKERMIELVYKKYLNQDKPDSATMNKLMEADSTLYQEKIVKKVSTPNNEFFKDLSWRERRALAKSNKKTGAKKSIISPKNDFTNVLSDISIDTRNPFRRVIDARRFKAVGTEPEYFKDQFQPFDSLRRLSDGKKIKSKDILDEILHSIQQRRGKETRIRTENLNPFIRIALKKVLGDRQIETLVADNKQWRGVKEIVETKGVIPEERSMMIMIKAEAENRTKDLFSIEPTKNFIEGKGIKTKDITDMEDTKGVYKKTSDDLLKPVTNDVDGLGKFEPDLLKVQEDIQTLYILKEKGGKPSTLNKGKNWTVDDAKELESKKWEQKYIEDQIKELKKTEKEIKGTKQWSLINDKTKSLDKKIKHLKDQRVQKWYVTDTVTGKKQLVKSKQEAKRKQYLGGKVPTTMKEVYVNPITKIKETHTFEQLSTPFNIAEDLIDEVAIEKQRKLNTALGAPFYQDTDQVVLRSKDTQYARGAPVDINPPEFMGPRVPYKQTLDQTIAIVRQSVYKDLGIPLDSTTSLGRSVLGKSLSDSMKTAFKKQSSTSGGIKTLEAYLKSDEATKTLNTKGFMDRMNKWDAQISVMENVSDRTASRMGTTPQGLNSFSPEQIKGKVLQSQKRDNTVGFRQQFVSGGKASYDVGSNVSTKTGLVPKQDTEPTEGFSLYQEAYAEPSIVPPQPKNILDQTIGDIQKTMDGIVTGTKNIGKRPDGDVKSYEMSQSLNIFGGSSSTVQQSQSPNLLAGLEKEVGARYGYVTMPDFNTVLGTQSETQTIPGTIQANVPTQAEDQQLANWEVLEELPKVINKIKLGTSIKQNIRTRSSVTTVAPIIHQFVIPPQLKPKVIPQRIFPLVPAAALYDPGDPQQRFMRKRKKAKKKKTWWQTPENWWQPYYWGGKDQQGAGYVTFTGKEPAKVKKYEKKYFGIGVNDSPFGVRSKWF